MVAGLLSEVAGEVTLDGRAEGPVEIVDACRCDRLDLQDEPSDPEPDDLTSDLVGPPPTLMMIQLFASATTVGSL